MKWYSWKGIVAKNAGHGESFQKISFLLGAKKRILKRKWLQPQVMYVALIGLQFIERIYIGPNEAHSFIATNRAEKTFRINWRPTPGCRHGKARCMEACFGPAGKSCVFGIPVLLDSILLVEETLSSPVEVGSLSHYLRGFKHPRWCRISSIKSTAVGYRCYFITAQ